MVFVNSIKEYKQAGDYSILLSKDSPVLIINKFKEPILVKLYELDTFIQGFFIREELIEWVCQNLQAFQEKPDILKTLLTKISQPNNIQTYTKNDGTSKTEILGTKHRIEVWQDDFGSLVKVKDKRNRILAKASIYDKKIITTTVRSENDDTQFVILYPKSKDKLEVSIDQIQHWRDKHESKKSKS